MAAKGPNLLYVFADQWRRQATGFAGEDPVLTPNIDRFAQQSLIFRNALSSTPLCSPHRAALMTGKYPLSTGVYTNCKQGADIMLRPEEIGIGDVLKEAGYQTGYIGKWHLDLPEQNVTEEPESGARHWDAYTPPGPKRHGFDFWYSYGAYDHHLEPHYWRDTPEMIQLSQWSPEHETDVAIDYISGLDRDRPFAIFVSWNPPHSPFELLPDKYKEMYRNREVPFRPNVQCDTLQAHTGEPFAGGRDNLEQYMRDYFAAVTGIDEQFGRLLAALEELGLERDTIVVLSSDHGELLGAHGLMAKHSWHEESIGIPCVIRWPGKVAPGTTGILFNSPDIMPTLLGLAGLPIPDTVEGTNVAPVLLGEAMEGPASAFLAAIPGRREVVEQFAQAGIDNKRFGWRAVRTDRYTYVVDRGYSPDGTTVRLLYDNAADPHQLRPTRLTDAAESSAAARLEQELRAYLRRTNDPFDLAD